jgi:Zn-dependent protease
MQRYTPRDILVLAVIAGLFVWYFGRTSFGSPENFVIFVIALVLAITFHEFAHASVALALGDSTAKLLGRVSLNPIRHLDLMGSLAFIFFHFGWGKPVPINPYNMRNVSPLVGAMIAAVAGPASNVLFAFLITIPLRMGLIGPGVLDPYSAELLRQLLSVNILLAAFNFLPIPPLDGFSIARLVLPYNVSAWLEQYGMFILIILVFLPQFFGRQFDVLGMAMRPLQGLIQEIVFVGM